MIPIDESKKVFKKKINSIAPIVTFVKGRNGIKLIVPCTCNRKNHNIYDIVLDEIERIFQAHKLIYIKREFKAQISNILYYIFCFKILFQDTRKYP